MFEVFVCFYMALILLDCIAIFDMRHLVFEFLIVGKNIKGAYKIHKQQRLSDRITLSYIERRVRDYKSQFKFNHLVYLLTLYSLIPQYVILILCNMLLKEKSLYVIGCFAVLKFFICLIARLQVDSSRVSIYRQRKR